MLGSGGITLKGIIASSGERLRGFLSAGEKWSLLETKSLFFLSFLRGQSTGFSLGSGEGRAAWIGVV